MTQGVNDDVSISLRIKKTQAPCCTVIFYIWSTHVVHFLSLHKVVRGTRVEGIYGAHVEVCVLLYSTVPASVRTRFLRKEAGTHSREIQP